MSCSPKIPFYGRRYTTRSTTGCLTCRRRRLKCDEAKPVCTRCADGALECTYAGCLRWPTKGAKPGNNRSSRFQARRELVYESGSKQQHLTLSRSSTSLGALSESTKASTDDLYGSSSSHERQPQLSTASRSLAQYPSSSRGKWSIKSLGYGLPISDTQDRMLFDFYASKMCPRCMVRNGGNKTYRQVVLPLIFESDLLLKTVLAVAANSLRVQDERFQTIAWRYQNLSLNGLQRSITSPELTWFSRVEALSIVLMLCFFDIYSPAPASMEPHGFPLRPWRAHSLGVRRLLEHKVSPQSQNTHYEQAILSFLGQYFASRCVLTYATVSEGEDSTGLFEDAAHWLGVIDRPPTEIDPFAGCSNQLLGIILSILYEVRSRRISNTSSSDYDDNWVHNTRQELLNIQQHPPADVCHQVARNGVKSCVKATAEAFRFAALILLEALSDPASQSRKAYYISQIFGLVEAGVKIPPCGKLGSSSYLWPYFIVGCHLTCLEQQAAMLQHLDAMTGTGTSQNSPTNVSETTTPMVKQIKDVLMSVWVRATSTSGDLERSFLAHDMDRSWNDRFAWEMVIACGNIMMEWV